MRIMVGKEASDPGQEAYSTTVTINVPVVYMVRYKVVLRGDYP
jgi:hypothetical protein